MELRSSHFRTCGAPASTLSISITTQPRRDEFYLTHASQCATRTGRACGPRACCRPVSSPLDICLSSRPGPHDSKPQARSEHQEPPWVWAILCRTTRTKPVQINGRCPLDWMVALRTRPAGVAHRPLRATDRTRPQARRSRIKRTSWRSAWYVAVLDSGAVIDRPRKGAWRIASRSLQLHERRSQRRLQQPRAHRRTDDLPCDARTVVARLPHREERDPQPPERTVPVSGSMNSFAARAPSGSKRSVIGPARRSNEVSLMRSPPSQRSSMKRRTELWSMSALLT